MKELDFKTRSSVAKMCINRVCEAAGLKTIDKKKKIDKKVLKAIAEEPKMDHAGTNVNLKISSSSLTLTSFESGEVIASHDMPKISFASGKKLPFETFSFDFLILIVFIIIFFKRKFPKSIIK